MRYVKKSCILRQLKSGFTSDGKPLTGIIKVEQYGSNVAAELAFSNLSPAAEGGYYCILADSERRYKLLSLESGNRFSFTSNMDVAAGFYTALCFVHEKAAAIAVGVCGKLPYDLFALVQEAFSAPDEHAREELNTDMPPTNQQNKAQNTTDYDDELVADENYYEQENTTYEQSPAVQTEQNAPTESRDSHQGAEERVDSATDENHASVRHAFTTETDGYYQSVKGELNGLFKRYPADNSLQAAYPHSEWVRVKGEEGNPQELVGLVYENGLVKYICYALTAGEATPQEVKERGYYVPISALSPEKGFYVLYQSAATGESILKQEA